MEDKNKLDKEQELALFENQKVLDVGMEKEVRKSFIEYSMSVIISRALPDVRDGMKPGQRRILYAMYEDPRFTAPWCAWRSPFRCAIP